jgi:tetratricopeptide (TPR) repeat protein
MAGPQSYDRGRSRRQAERRTKPARAASLLEKFRLQSTLAVAVLLALFSLLALTSAQRKSPTVDEPLHLFSGYTYIRWGDFRANPEHPPLAKIVAALPLAFVHIRDFRPSPSWDLIPKAPPTALYTANAASEMLFVHNDAETLFAYSKLMMIGLGIALGYFIYTWSKALFGTAGALAALLIYVLDPNILAHAPLVHTDLPFAALFFISTYLFWRTLNEVSIRSVTLTAIVFALAAVTKYAYVSILSAWTLLGIYRICASQPIQSAIGKRQPITSRLAKSTALMCILGCALVAAYAAVWAVYGFQYYAIPGGKSPLPFHHLWPRSALMQSLASFSIQHHLVPEAWLYGQLSLLESLNRDSYLLGQTSLAKGSYLYFPVAFVVKTPIPTLVLLTAAVVFLARGNRSTPAPGAPESVGFGFSRARVTSHDCGIMFRQRLAATPWLAIPVVTYFSFAMASGLNIGLRHILAIYPFLFVLCGGMAAGLWRSGVKAQRASVMFLGAWYVLSSAAAFPNYLAYFNEFIGGPRYGHKILLDSNLDWGQDLKELRRWMDTAGVKNIQYSYFGFPSATAPRYYGIDALFLPGSWVHPNDISPDAKPRPQFLAISVNQLHGLYFEGGDKEFITSLREIEPLARVGYSIWVYRMDGAIEEFRRRVQTKPGSARDHYHLANLLNHQGESHEAIARYRQALKIQPGFADAHKRLALALAKAGAFEPAIEHLRTVLRIDPRTNEGEIQYYLGTLLLYQGRYPEAAESLRAAVHAEPNSPRAYQQLGRLFSAQGNLDEAVQYYRNAIRLDSMNANLHVHLSRALAAQGKRDEAISHYEIALNILRAGPKPTSSPDSSQNQP